MEVERQKTYSYDVVCSLGDRCMVAHQMRLNGLRSISNPFDWLISENLNAVVDTLLTAGDKFFLKENIRLENRKAEHLTAIDSVTGFVSLHDFAGELPFDEEYELVIKKYRNRISRLLELLRNSKSILFVRTNVNEKGMEKLLELQSVNPEANMDFLIVNTVETDEMRYIPCKYDNVFVYEISEKPDVDYDMWMGNHAHWKQVLSQFSLNEYEDWLLEGLKREVKDRNLVIWGFGGAGKKIISQLQANPKEVAISWVIDSNPEKWGDVDGKFEIKGSTSLSGHFHDTVVLICVYGQTVGIEQQLEELQYPRKQILKVVYEGLSPVRLEHL